MRRLLLIVVLLVMVPLRTWAGDAMAIQMAARSSANTASSVISAPAPCHATPAQASPAAHDHSTHATHAPCASCAVCQACASVALLAPAPRALSPALPHALPQTGHDLYTSVTVALSHKPPIS